MVLFPVGGDAGVSDAVSWVTSVGSHEGPRYEPASFFPSLAAKRRNVQWCWLARRERERRCEGAKRVCAGVGEGVGAIKRIGGGEGRVCRSSFGFASWRIGSWVSDPLAPTDTHHFRLAGRDQLVFGQQEALHEQVDIDAGLAEGKRGCLRL